MQRRPLTTLSDYLDIARRRWKLVLIPSVVLPILVLLVSLRIPKIYKSETLILVEPQKIAADYVKPTISGDVTDRLQTISQQILSRTRLQKVIDQFGLYQKERATKSQEEIIDAMRADITVDIVADPRPERKSIGGFRVAYFGRDPHTVQLVAQQLAALFIEENLKVREQQSEGTTEFIENEVVKTKTLLDQQEADIRRFKSEHMGSLPEQQNANLQLISQLQALLQTNNDALSRADQQRIYLESMLATLEKSSDETPKTELQSQLDTARGNLAAAERIYKPGHPDVQRLRSQVSALESQAAATRDKSPSVSAGSPYQLRSQLMATNQEIKQRRARQGQIESQMRALQGRIESLPAVEMRFAELNRDYESTRAQYKILLEKKGASSMAAEMERRAKGEQFRVLDPANLPQMPVKPNLLQVNMLGLLGAIGFGCVLAGLAEARDQALHSRKDAEYYLGVPVLIQLPELQAIRSGLSRDEPRSV